MTKNMLIHRIFELKHLCSITSITPSITTYTSDNVAFKPISDRSDRRN